jgi:hypothetical protein
MSARARRRFYLTAVGLAVVLFCAGILAGYLQRDNAICKDGKPPVEQRDNGLGQIDYRCHDGSIVSK